MTKLTYGPLKMNTGDALSRSLVFVSRLAGLTEKMNLWTHEHLSCDVVSA